MDTPKSARIMPPVSFQVFWFRAVQMPRGMATRQARISAEPPRARVMGRRSMKVPNTSLPVM